MSYGEASAHGSAHAVRERFSASAVAAWKHAAAECQQLQQFYLGVEHLFLGLAFEAPVLLESLLLEAVTAPAAGMLASIAGAIRDAAGSGPPPDWDKVRVTPRVRIVLELSDLVREQSGAAEVEPIHLLTAIIQEGASLPTRVLAREGVDLAALRRTLERFCAPHRRGAGSNRPTPHLDRLGRDLVEMARDGKFDPLIGRERELELLMEVLCRRSKNNPVLLGEAGVGKTAIVEGLAKRIAEDRAPPPLRGTRLIALNANRLLSGGGVERVLLELLEEVRLSPNVTLFVDEMHTLAGGSGVDAAAILKPPLARGEIRCIGATTTAEYRRFVEGEAALERRFQPIMVDEPGKPQVLEILKGLRDRYERHHGVTIPDDALAACVDLSSQYLRDRQQPDKAIDLMDQSAARVAIRASGAAVNRPIYSDGSDGQCSLPYVVMPSDVASLVSDLVGVAVPLSAGFDPARLRSLDSFLNSRLLGQEEAVAAVSQVIRMAKRELDLRPFRPDGVILLAGPGGVGKSTLARAVCEFLHPENEDALVRIDMSEFSEPHSLARLVGPPPGYVGYEEEGQLTGRIRTHPDSVLLLDDIDKAHPAVRALFLQVFDEGLLTDSRGRCVHFDHATIILTTTLGCSPEDTAVGFAPSRPESGRQRSLSLLEDEFGGDFLGRIDRVIVMKPLDNASVVLIAERMLERLQTRLKSEGKRFEIEAGAASILAAYRFNPRQGARHLARALEDLVIEPLTALSYSPVWNDSPGIELRIVRGCIELAPLSR